MTSEERHELRYQRRKAKRHQRKIDRCMALGKVSDIFSYRKMFRYGKKCCNGVRWKMSTQNFERHLFSGTAKRRKAVLTGKWKQKRYVHFIIHERGKVRPIDAPHISDRQIHKTLSNEVLLPLFVPCMIYDNGASQKGKGLQWHFKRVKKMLSEHYRKYGRNGAVILMDLKKFFPNAPHRLLYYRHRMLIPREKIRKIADFVVANSPTARLGKGMPLGVEPSQQEMIAMPSAIDNWIKCQLRIKGMAHYMDDYFMLIPDIEKAKDILGMATARFEASGILVNRQKCKVIPLTKSFRICKTKFTLTPSGRIIMNGCRDGMKRARRKLNFFTKEHEAGRMPTRDIRDYLTCQKAFYEQFNDHGRILKLNRIFYALFERRQYVSGI